MKIRILSDTHLESYTGEYDAEHHTVNPSLEKLINKLNQTIQHVSKSEVLVLPGDLGMVTDKNGKFNPDYEKLLHYFKSRWEHIVIVPGNTEYQGLEEFESLIITEDVLEAKCKEMGIIYLQKGVVKINEYYFVGCTLWSYIDRKEWKNMKEADKEIFVKMVIYKAQYVDHLEWLNNILTVLKEQGQKAVVITHYPPVTEAKNPSYSWTAPDGTKHKCNHMEHFIWCHKDAIKAWICGHVHDKHFIENSKVPVYINSLGESWEKDNIDLMSSPIEL
jgi:predicted phosphohydrolase